MIFGLLTGLTVMAAVVLSALAIYVWRRREAAAGLSLAVLLLSAAWWATAYALELSATDLATRGHWGDLKYVGICLLGPAWLVFVLQYTGHERVVTRRLLRAAGDRAVGNLDPAGAAGHSRPGALLPTRHGRRTRSPWWALARRSGCTWSMPTP